MENDFVEYFYLRMLKTKSYLIQGSGYFFHTKMIAPVVLMGKGLLPLKKAKYGVGSCSSDIFKPPVVNCKVVAAVRLSRQQPGILS
jgi:hypothetical protein